MARMNFSHTTEKSREEIWKWVLSMEETLRRKLPAREKVTVEEHQDEGRIKLNGTHIKAEIAVDHGKIDIIVDVPLLYRFFQPQIEAAVKSAFQQL